MIRTSRFWNWLALALLALSAIFLLSGYHAHRAAEAKAEQQALDGSAHVIADTLGVELDGAPEPRVDTSAAGRTRLAFGGALLLLSAGSGAVGMVIRTSSSSPAATHAGAPSSVPTPNPFHGDGVMQDVPRRSCPECGERIAVAARLCRFCQSAVPPSGQSRPSE